MGMTAAPQREIRIGHWPGHRGAAVMRISSGSKSRFPSRNDEEVSIILHLREILLVYFGQQFLPERRSGHSRRLSQLRGL